MTATVIRMGSSGISRSRTTDPRANAPIPISTIAPKPKLPAPAAEGTLRNQPREVTWLRTEVRIRSCAVVMLP